MTDALTITKKTALKDNREVVQLYFPYNQELINLVKTNTPARWSQTERCWYLEKDELNLEKFSAIVGNSSRLDVPGLKIIQVVSYFKI